MALLRSPWRRPWRGWTPDQLFIDGSLGIYLPVWKLSSMFQDVAGTIPAAVNSPVALRRDMSGNGIHLYQTDPAKCAILRQEGGLYYLEYDGVNDFYTTDVNAYLPATVSVSGAFRSNTANRLLYQVPHAVPPAAPWARWLAHHHTTGKLQIRWNGNNYESTLAFPIGQNAIISLYSADGDAYVNKSLYINQAPVTLTYPNAVPLTIGAGTDSGNPMAGREYGFITSARNWTQAERDQVNKYLAAKAGIVL